jgi:hypothetical protein
MEPTMSDELPIATVAHAMRGRARLRLADMRGDEKFFAAAAEKLSAIPGVAEVVAAPLTGGLLVRHHAPLEAIGEAAREAGLFRLSCDRPAEAAPAELRFDPRIAGAAALALLAAWQFRKEKLFPSAFTLALHAASLAGFRWAGESEGEMED